MFHLGGRASVGGPRVDSARPVAVSAPASVEATASVAAAVAAAAETPRGVAVAGGLAALLAGLGRGGRASGLLREVPLNQSLPFDSSLAR